MYALVESGNITKIFHNPQGFKLGDNQYSADVFTKWSNSEREAIGIYSVIIDNSNKKNEKWYINTDQTFTYDASAKTVTAAYGSATAKAHADVNWTQSEIDDGDAPEGATTSTVKTPGLKSRLIEDVKKRANGILSKTDWYVTRKSEKSTAIPNNISIHRDAVRTKQAEMETAITNAADTAALETLYTYVEQEDGSLVRPLGELPELES
tara:strand:+ start:452 stop:1078 length:627 start_codon:yes stop_codon:yes gene_type:complete